MRLEVRCCCNPKKLMGWLDVPRDPEPVLRFQLTQPLTMATLRVPPQTSPLAPQLCMRVREFHPGPGEPSYWALSSDEATLEELQRIPGFEAAP